MPHKDRALKLSSQRRCTYLARYGISLEGYEIKYNQQGGRCAICGEPGIMGTKNGLQVDHNHSTGATRGLLCQKCNVRLGFWESNTSPFVAAMKEYLSKW